MNNQQKPSRKTSMRIVDQPVRLTIWICLLLFASLLLHAASSSPSDAITPDGGRYYGPLVDGKLHGYGQLEWNNGAHYEGGFNKGLFSGRGQLKLPSEDWYEGNFDDGAMSGQGRMVMRDGSIYTGEFRNNTFNGLGRYETLQGEVYEGDFENGRFDGKGRLTGANGKYQGEFRLGQYAGEGELTYEDGRKYAGEFLRGQLHGKGRFENPGGEIYEGDFNKNEFTGRGTYTRGDGSRYQGEFLKWRPHGQGKFRNPAGNEYEGQFANGELTGKGRLTEKDGTRYEGEFKQWSFHGQGVLTLTNGDVYKGAFAHGLYEGEGTLTYATPRSDGRTQDSGVWHFGMLDNEGDKNKTKVNVETALYNQRTLLDKAVAALLPRNPEKINLYLLAIAGDGAQEVFRREVEFVRQQFDHEFGTQGHSLLLINSRSTAETAPMATITSIRESLNGIAARMDKEKDVLFLFLTSHGSKDHEVTLDQNGIDLRGLPAKELGSLLKGTGIQWKVVVISACYAGGFIDAIKDDHTLVITAARHDRRSFGCADGNDFTYFGRAFFKEALPKSHSFQEAFHKAEVLVNDWEAKELKTEGKAENDGHSLPQMYSTPAIEEYLQRWRSQTVTTKAHGRVAKKVSRASS